MWFDNVPEGRSWAHLWFGYIICGDCSGIRTTAADCPACGSPPPVAREHVVRSADGSEYTVRDAFMGAEARYEDWIYLRMLEKEWKRPLSDIELLSDVPDSMRPSARASVVLIFWSYFETRIDRLFRQAMRDIPDAIQKDLLRRYATIGARLDRLYTIVFASTYWSDLAELGFEQVAGLLKSVQKQRNEFAHGKPAAIDDSLVKNVVASLQSEHEGWIAIFNKRAVKRITR